MLRTTVPVPVQKRLLFVKCQLTLCPYKYLFVIIERDPQLTDAYDKQWHRLSVTVPVLMVTRIFGHLAFAVAGPMPWNLLPDTLPDPMHSFGSLRHDFKTFLVSVY